MFTSNNHDFNNDFQRHMFEESVIDPNIIADKQNINSNITKQLE